MPLKAGKKERLFGASLVIETKYDTTLFTVRDRANQLASDRYYGVIFMYVGTSLSFL